LTLLKLFFIQYYTTLRNVVCCVLFFSSLLANHSFAQNGWGANTFSQTTNEAADIETTNTGSHYVAGFFSGQTSFGPVLGFNGTNGSNDAYIAKYDVTGNVTWIRQYGGSQDDRAVDVAIGPDQNIVVCGSFFGSITFGSTTLTSSASSKDIFIVKMDPSGNILWARKEGGSGIENAFKLAIDAQNNVIITGEYQGNSTIGSSNLVSTINPGSGNPSFDIFVLKYDSSGTPLWTVTGTADYDDRGLSVDVDNTNNIYLTGQFSDTLVFAGNTINNNGFNIGYLAKLNPAGQFQFFNQFKAGMVVPYDIELNSDNESIVIGDFLGNMTYVNQSGSVNIQNPYEKQIFWVKTNASGQYIWNNTLGSDNELSARTLAIDPSNSIYITGYFKCDLSQLQDSTEYLYNSVGFKDPYLIKASNNGSRTYVKQFGGKLDDEGKGISAYPNDKPAICGSYIQDLNFQSGTTPLLGGDNFTLNPFYGAEPYHIYLVGDQSKNSFLETHVNSTYGAYNFFAPPANDSLIGHITANQIPDYVTLENDTVHFCLTAELSYDPLTYSHFGPSYDHLWYNGATTPFSTISATGDYWVRVERIDDCEFDLDTIHGILEPIPALPLLTDDHGVNVNAPGPDYLDYHYCYPESVTLLFSGLDPGSVLELIGPDQTYNGVGPHVIDTGIQYSVHVENEYCMANGEFIFVLDLALDPDTLSPGIVMATDVPTGDSVEICQGFPVEFHGIDLFVNTAANYSPQIQIPIDTVMWEINGVPTPNFDTSATAFSPATSGWYTVEMTVIVGYDNLCGVDTIWYTTSQQFYITVNQNPSWNPMVSGPTLLCPGDSDYLISANPHPDLIWSGPTPIWTNGYDSLLINTPGWYTYSGTLVDSITGCSVYILYNQYLGLKMPPEITTNVPDGVVCPGDSIQLAVPNFYSTYVWIDQNGDTISELSFVYVQDIGLYECHVTDADGCLMVANPFEVFQYSTPTLTVEPDAVLCANESATIHITHSGNIDILWENGSTADSLIVSSPGVYVVELTQCGVTIEDSVVIIDGTFDIGDILGDLSLCYGEDGVFYVNGVPDSSTIEWYSGTDFVGNMNPISFPYSTLENENNISVTVANSCYTQTVQDVVLLYPQTQLSLSEDTLKLCADEDQLVSVLNNNLDSVQWSTPFQTEEDFEVTFDGATTYPMVNVVGFDQNACPTNVATIVVHGSDRQFSAQINFDTYCEDTPGNIVITTNSDSLHWETPFGDFTSNQLDFVLTQENSGMHIIHTWDSLGCEYTHVITVNAILPPNLNLLPDTIFCLNDIYTFYFPNDTNSYTWLGLGNTNELPITGNQDFVLQITSQSGCVYYDTLFVETVDCGGPLPNVVTPNGDGVNDYFYFDDVFSQLENEIFIINRWGQQIFHAAPYQNTWSGEGLSEGVYFYIYYPKGSDHKDIVKQGFIHLVF